jgi:hypothetical protein
VNILKIQKNKGLIALVVILIAMIFNTLWDLPNYPPNITKVSHYAQWILCLIGVLIAFSITRDA